MGNLARKLLAGPGIQFVGAISNIASGTSATMSLDLTALTGGIGSAAIENDIVIVAHMARSNADLNTGVSTSGYDEIAELYANASTSDCLLSVAWKRMGSTPDTSVATLAADNRQVAIAYVLRGVNVTTAIDVTTTTTTATGTGIADPPSIVPVTVGAAVIAIGANISGATTAVTGPSGYSNHVTRVNDVAASYPHLGVAMKLWSSGTENPGAWSGITDAGTYGTAAVTLALRPA